MMKRNDLYWCSANIFRKLFLVSVLLQISLGFDIFDDGKHDEMIPFNRLEKASILTGFDGKKRIGGLLTYPRLGRHVWEIQPATFRHPQAEQLIVEPEPADYNILRDLDVGTFGLDDTLNDAFLNKGSVVKRSRSLKLIPRIGRKKRSLPDEHGEHEKPSESENDQDMTNSGGSKSIRDSLRELDDDYYDRVDKKSFRSKNAFIPRIGKRFDDLDDIDKRAMAFAPRIGRAMAFTPRIGRASLIPRIGRSDPPFRLRSRGAFVPRIGRRAALIPRIGRSTNQEAEKE